MSSPTKTVPMYPIAVPIPDSCPAIAGYDTVLSVAS